MGRCQRRLDGLVNSFVLGHESSFGDGIAVDHYSTVCVGSGGLLVRGYERQKSVQASRFILHKPGGGCMGLQSCADAPSTISTILGKILAAQPVHASRQL